MKEPWYKRAWIWIATGAAALLTLFVAVLSRTKRPLPRGDRIIEIQAATEEQIAQIEKEVDEHLAQLEEGKSKKMNGIEKETEEQIAQVEVDAKEKEAKQLVVDLMSEATDDDD